MCTTTMRLSDHMMDDGGEIRLVSDEDDEEDGDENSRQQLGNANRCSNNNNSNNNSSRNDNGMKSFYCCGSIHQVMDDDDGTWWWWCLYSWWLLVLDVLCFIGFILVLLPGFVRFGWYYWVTSSRTSVKYGTYSCRQTLDVYTVPNKAAAVVKSKKMATEVADTTRLFTLGTASSRSSVSDTITATSDEQRSLEAENHEDCLATTPLLATKQSCQEQQQQQQRPVVLFFPGGAWMIGYKMWGSLTARVLTHVFGIVVVVADYQNHVPPYWCSRPATIPDMVDDVSAAIEWTRRHVHEYGGDAQQLWVVGQSAGGHLLTTAILRRARQIEQQQEQHHRDDWKAQELKQAEDYDHGDVVGGGIRVQPTWRPSYLKGLISVSAPYNFTAMNQTFRRHGLSRHVVNQMFSTQEHGGEDDPDDYDPYCIVTSSTTSVPHPRFLPPLIHIWHGAKDATVPWQLAQDFARVLQDHYQQNGDENQGRRRRKKVEYRLYPSWTHTDAILEGPMSGDHDFHLDLARVVLGGNEAATGTNGGDNETSLVYDPDHSFLKPMWCPVFLAQLGKFFIPF